MSSPEYPEAIRSDLAETIAGHYVRDPYRWLEDPDDPAVVSWLTAQDRLFRSHIEAISWRPRLASRISALRACGEISVPVWRGSRRFFTRRGAGQEHPVLYMVDEEETEHVLIDPAAIDSTGVTTLDEWEPDIDGRRLAYQLSVGGTEESVLYVRGSTDPETIDGPIDNCRSSSVAWLPGGNQFYYVRATKISAAESGDEAYHDLVYLHTVGSGTEDDIPVFGSGMDETAHYEVGLSPNGRWLVISASQETALSNDVWLADLWESSPGAPELRPLQEGVDAQTAAFVRSDGRVYLLTDRDAPRGRLCVTNAVDCGYSNWRELVAQDDEAVISDYAVLDGADAASQLLLVVWEKHAISEITVHKLATGEQVGRVQCPGLGSITGITERPEGGHHAWFGYTDNVTPPCVYRYDALEMKATQWAAAPGAAVIPAIKAEQISFPSRDGTTIRMLVLARPGDAGERPAILNGYGGFGVSLTPTYRPSVIAWVEAGGVYAIASVRGGGEEGAQWHRGGILENKQRTFDDFRVAAEHLISSGWTSPSQLGVYGSSSGGLLVGAALTQYPSLFAAAVCAAPLLDMIRYHLFGLGPSWAHEYGTAEDPEQLEWLLSYSPYHNVHEGTDYPATLFAVAESDTRVDPLHARKMCAALQNATSGNRPILLRNEAMTGHGARAESRTIGLSVDMLSFLAEHTGLVETR